MAKEKLVGKITHYFTAIGVGIVKAKERIRLGDKLHFKGATTDFYQEVGSIQSNYKSLKEAKKGMEIGIKVKERVREGDGVYSTAREASQKSKAGGRGKKKSLSKKTKSGKIRKVAKRKPKKAAKKIVGKKPAGKTATKGKKKTARKTVRRTKVKKSAGRAVRKSKKRLRKSASKKGKKR